MRLTLHAGRLDASGKHNDRNFDLTLAPHILKERMQDNRYYSYAGDMEKTFQEQEIEYYREHFGKYLNNQKKKYEKDGHPERAKTIKQYHGEKHTRPEDLIIQVGDRNTHITGEELWQLANDYRERFEKIYGDHCKVLNMALHMDEETPHIHIRRVWSYEDENGLTKVGQSKALEQMGILPPDPTKPLSQTNNAKITFTATERGILTELCEERGIHLEKEPKPRRPHLSVFEFRNVQKQKESLEKEIGELEREKVMITQQKERVQEELEEKRTLYEAFNESLRNFLLREEFMHQYDKMIENAKKQSKEKELIILVDIFRAEAEKAFLQNSFNAMLGGNEKNLELEHKAKLMQDFIVKNGYEEEFEKYTKGRKKERPGRSKE